MDFVNKILSIIGNATAQPILFFVIMVLLIGVSIWGGMWLNKLREMKAQAEKEKDKAKDIDPLETAHETAHDNLEDRLNGKKNP